MKKLNRREFVRTTTAAGVAAATPLFAQGPTVMTKSVKPLVIASSNGHKFKNGGSQTCVETAFQLIARGSDVLLQFLVEAIVISLFGGLLGIGLGFGLSAALEKFLQWPTSIPPNAIGMAFGFAAATGVFFGFYPARKAAGLDPIEALRYE